MNNYDLFKNAYLQLILQSIKDECIIQLQKKNIENPEKIINDTFKSLNLSIDPNKNDPSKPKKQKALLHWLKNGTITDPTEQKQKQILQKAFNLLSKHASLNFQNFNSPIDMLNSSDKSVQKINAEYKFNPETEPKFFNKKDLGDGIVVYQVEDSKEGQAAVRKAIDSDWGYDKNPWCLAARNKESLNGAWEFWNNYKAIPKRIAFKNGKLHAFSATSDPYTCQWWDRNDKSSESIPQTTVSDDPDFLIQFCPFTYVKNNPNSPLAQDAWKKLSEDKNRNVISRVAENPKCPPDILKKLSEQNFRDKYIMQVVATNPNCPPDILKKLSEHKDEDVRIAVAKNHNCPPDILKKLSEQNFRDKYIILWVAANPNCPPDILKKLSEHKDEDVRSGVAKNPNCPQDILKKLSEQDFRDNYIMYDVAKNPNCPPDVLKKLSKHKDSSVRSRVVKNPNCPVDILRKIS